jgi:hypothetical protein
MRTIAALVIALAVLAPAAQAKELQANVVSMQSQLTPGEPVPVVFVLNVREGAARTYPVARAADVALLLISKGRTERFAATALDRGRYSTELVFPAAGEWKLAVSVGDHTPIPLGKGAVRIDGEASTDSRIAELPLMLAGAALLAFLHVRTRRR